MHKCQLMVVPCRPHQIPPSLLLLFTSSGWEQKMDSRVKEQLKIVKLAHLTQEKFDAQGNKLW